ncbi:MAG: Flp pilus assembly protein CpaB [Alphaproteobacteria bacterium]|nr:Flp pilus assembly protein CpaB [Alphaproteobacteria bacterium]
MNKNIIIVLVGGFLIAVLVAVLVQSSLKGKKGDESGTPKVQILVAGRDLPIGREIKEGDIKWQTWPESFLFDGAIIRQDNMPAQEAAKGRVIQAIKSGQPVHPGLLIGETKANFLAAKLKEGMRAMGISVKAQNIAGGFVGPGDYVDVIVTYKVNVDGRPNPAVQSMVNKQASETILENVRVLASDQQAIREEDKAKVARTITLEVDSEGAEKLALATRMGDVTLSLRGIGDNTQKKQGPMTTDVKMSRVLKNLAQAQSSEEGSGGKVRIFNGQDVMIMNVRQPLPDQE